MLGQELLVDARLVIIAVQVGGGRELDEVFVAGLVLHQQAEVMILFAVAGLTFQAGAGRHVHFAADDGLDALGAGRLVKLNHPVHRPVVGDGEGREFQRVRPVHQLVQTARPVEERVLGVQMQMDKVGV